MTVGKQPGALRLALHALSITSAVGQRDCGRERTTVCMSTPRPFEAEYTVFEHAF